MAPSPLAMMKPLPLAGSGLALALALACLLPLAAVIWAAGGLQPLSGADLSALRFTILQAFLSALFSVGLAIPTARALARRNFPLRGALITLLGAPFLMPTLVAVTGIVMLFGQSGLVNTALEALGLPKFSIYGLHGVVLAHLFFNLPLATRMILQGWQSIPQERLRLAIALNAPIGPVLERPMLREVAPGAFALIFLICLSSFAVALTLGGGPRATTMELALYQAVLFDFDLPRAASLGLWQLALCSIAGVIAALLTRSALFGIGLDRAPLPLPRAKNAICDGLFLSFASLLLVLPLAAVLLRGIPSLILLPNEVWAASLRSLSLALLSALLTSIAATALALRGGLLAKVAGSLPLAVSSLLLGIGAFLLLYPILDPASLALPVTLTANCLLALPFAYRQIAPAAEEAQRNFARLALSLRLSPWARLRHVYLPRLRRPLGFAAGLTAALSMGDLGVIALFAQQDSATLPLVMQRLMGAYRMEAAAGAGVLLLFMAFGLYLLFDLWGRRADV